MIRTKYKFLSVILFALILLILSGVGFADFKEDVKSKDIETMAEIEKSNLGGVIGRMPDNSAKILFESLLGLKLNSYQAYQSVEETLTALKANEIDVAWFSDVTARYLLQTNEGLKEIKTPDQLNDRLSFALALDKENTELQTELNQVLATIKEDGTLYSLINTYVDTSDYSNTFTIDDMKSDTMATTKDTLYIGVSGAVPPIDLLDEAGEPIGFSVALMDEIGRRLGRNVKFVVMKNEAMFSNLMSGKVDAIFCYGTSLNTMVIKKEYIMTDGYYAMNKYAYLVLE